VFEVDHDYTPQRTREATPTGDENDDTSEHGTGNNDGENPKHTNHTGKPRDASTPPTASDPRDAGDESTNTPPPARRAAAHERPMRRRRNGRGGRPPANHRTGTPAAAAADTAGKADPDQNPAPDAPPTANTDTDARAARSDDNQSASAPAEQPTRNSANRPETSDDAKPANTGDQTGDTTRDPPTNSTDRNENTTHLPQTPPNKTNHDGQHAAADHGGQREGSAAKAVEEIENVLDWRGADLPDGTPALTSPQPGAGERPTNIAVRTLEGREPGPATAVRAAQA
jgi:hypothetical protein